MSRIFSFVIAGAILGVSVALAAFLISLAPEPTRTELHPSSRSRRRNWFRPGPVPYRSTGPVP